MQTTSDVLHAVSSTAAGLQTRKHLIRNRLRLDLVVEGHGSYHIRHFLYFASKL